MLLPLSPAMVHLSRVVMPAAFLALWSAAFLTVLLLLGLFLGYVPRVLLAQAGFSTVCVLIVMDSNPK